MAERVADEKRDLAGGCELVANVVGCLNLSPKKTALNLFSPYIIHTSFHSSEPTLAYVVAGSDSITSENLRAAFPSACNKRSQRLDRLRPVSAIYLMDECAPFPGLTS